MKRLLLLIALFVPVFAFSVEPEWDDTSVRRWPEGFSVVEIPSSVDGKIQKAYFHKASKPGQPLLICLHSWSATFRQLDRLLPDVLAEDWNYIHPDFRGANRTPEAMVSDLVIADIDDAIDYALKNSSADHSQVHIIGASGGGLATLACYMKSRFDAASYSAWVPISDLEEWYYESLGRGAVYAEHILSSCRDGKLDSEELHRRSPLYAPFPKERRNGSPLFIYTGIHDGYNGSVPIVHSINMYNRLVGELKYKTADLEKISKKAEKDEDLVSRKCVVKLLSCRCNPDADPSVEILGRHVWYSNSYGGVNLVIFEGKHEQLPGALKLVPWNGR